MIYQSKGKYYIKLSGYLIEVIPFLKNGNLDFKTTQNKIEITADLIYKSVNIDDIRNKLKNSEIDNSRIDEDIDLKSKKLSERTHNKYKFKD